MEEILKNDISSLKLDKDIMNKLNKLGISSIYKICNCSRMELKEQGLKAEEVSDIIISLQLLGLDLKKNHAKRNTLLENKSVK